MSHLLVEVAGSYLDTHRPGEARWLRIPLFLHLRARRVAPDPQDSR
ncbi:MAG TPA: hypothetical protein VMU20_13460 [Candidatus Dormibacteraeota bacterium]|nr:hypothetical protein [Candidatus Dormibacteraeota bacterium]